MKRIAAILLAGCMLLTGCGQQSRQEIPYYNTEQASFYFLEDVTNHNDRFAANLAVIPKISYLEDDFKEEVNSALLVNDTSNTPVLAVNPHAKIYPASLTKMMTALVVLKYADMDDVVTIEQDIVFHESGVKVVNLKRGDKLTVRTLFNGLLVTSANDCGVALANYISGSEESFTRLMNKEAKRIGATNSHFVNSHGLHNDNHYTTAYDLYLIMKEASQYDEYLETVQQTSYTMAYTNAAGKPVTQTIATTDMYMNGTYALPADVTILAGKTGTTAKAGSCLVLLTENQSKERFISVVVGAIDKNTLYSAMSNLLKRENK